MLLVLCRKLGNPLLPTHSPGNAVEPAELPSAAFLLLAETLPGAPCAGASEGMTIAQKLQKQQEEAAVTLTAVERRRRKRQEYMNTSSGRDNRLFWFVVLATFVLPVVVILGVAFQSGYLDRLAGGYNSR